MNDRSEMKASLKRTLREGILPLLEMVAVMIVTVLLFRLIRNADGRFVQPSFNVGGDETDPSRGRLIYMIFAFIGSSVFTVYATILSKRSETGRGHGVWLCACAGGLLMWQALGECLWHFGFRNDMDGIPFSEGVPVSQSGTPLRRTTSIQSSVCATTEARISRSPVALYAMNMPQMLYLRFQRFQFESQPSFFRQASRSLITMRFLSA